MAYVKGKVGVDIDNDGDMETIEIKEKAPEPKKIGRLTGSKEFQEVLEALEPVKSIHPELYRNVLLELGSNLLPHFVPNLKPEKAKKNPLGGDKGIFAQIDKFLDDEASGKQFKVSPKEKLREVWGPTLEEQLEGWSKGYGYPRSKKVRVPGQKQWGTEPISLGEQMKQLFGRAKLQEIFESMPGYTHKMPPVVRASSKPGGHIPSGTLMNPTRTGFVGSPGIEDRHKRAILARYLAMEPKEMAGAITALNDSFTSTGLDKYGDIEQGGKLMTNMAEAKAFAKNHLLPDPEIVLAGIPGKSKQAYDLWAERFKDPNLYYGSEVATLWEDMKKLYKQGKPSPGIKFGDEIIASGDMSNDAWTRLQEKYAEEGGMPSREELENIYLKPDNPLLREYLGEPGTVLSPLKNIKKVPGPRNLDFPSEDWSFASQAPDNSAVKNRGPGSYITPKFERSEGGESVLQQIAKDIKQEIKGVRRQK